MPATAAAGSLGEAAGIFAANAAVASIFFGAALLVPALRRGPRTLDACLGTIAAANAIVLGAAVGALGPGSLARIAPHALLEIGALALSALVYLEAREGARAGAEPDTRRALRRVAIVLFALALAALVESFVSGALS